MYEVPQKPLEEAPSRSFLMSKRAAMVVAALVLAVVGIATFSLSFYQARESAVHAEITVPVVASTTPLTYGAWPALADYNFFEQVKRQFVANEATFIVADLDQMKLTLYQRGLVALEVPIAAKGKEGSWWETPAGLYNIQDRTESHYSSFGEVYQPWTLSFQGNFSIHGWPQYEGGKPVGQDYSGGCIRLSTDDARVLYEFSSVGMPVLVHSAPPELSSFQYNFKTPDIEATAFAAVDLGDGTVLAGENVSVQLPVASVTKLMTALVAVEYLNLERSVEAPANALVSTVVPRLVAGKPYRVYDLIVIMLTESSNEAAEALAHALGRDNFIELMNKKAETLGMQRTSFIDPSGLGTGNSSTVEDLFTLIKYIYESQRFILTITNDTLNKSVYGETTFRGVQNFNHVRGVPNEFLGGKIGNTNAARQTYLGVFGLMVGGEERPIVAVVLGASNSHQSVVTLLKYLNEFYELNPKPE